MPRARRVTGPRQLAPSPNPAKSDSPPTQWGVSLTSLLIVGAAIAIGAGIQGTIGFGMNLVAAPFIALTEPQLVPGPLLLATLAVTVPSAIAEWREIDRRDLGVGMVGRVPGNVAGAAAVALLPLRALTAIIGISILVGLGFSQWRAKRNGAPAADAAPPRIGTMRLLATSALSGFMGTATTVGGPPMALLYASHGAKRMRATLSAFFAIGLMFGLAALAIVGSLGVTELKAGGLLVPFVLVGWGTSWLIKPHVTDPARLKNVVAVVSAAAAVALLVQAAI